MGVSTYSGCTVCCTPPGVDACTCTGIPETLYATITADDTACCLHNKVVTLTYNSGTGYWSCTSAAPSATCTLSITMAMGCDSGTNQFFLTGLIIHINGNICAVNATVYESSKTCSPFSVTFVSLVTTDSCCDTGGTGGSFSVTVTP